MKTGCKLGMLLGVVTMGGLIACAQEPGAPAVVAGKPACCPTGAEGCKMTRPMAQQAGMQGGMQGGMRGGMQASKQGMLNPGMMMNPVRLKALGATDEQIKALETVKTESEEQSITLKANLDKAQLKLREAMKADTIDKKAVMEAVDAVGAARTEQFKAEITSQLKAREIIGPELMKKMREQPRVGQQMGGMQRKFQGPGMQGGQQPAVVPQPPAAPVQ